MGIEPLALIIVGLIVFGFVMERAGLVPALLAMFLIAAFGGHEFKLVEVIVLAAVMTVFSVVVFVHLLGVPYPLVQGF